VGKAKTAPEFMNSALKVAGLTAVRGQGLWALELGPGHNWFNHPTLMTGFGQMPKIFNYGLNDSSNSTADVAFVLDQRFYDVVREHPTKLYRMYIAWYLGLNWPQSGLNYDFYFSHDLNNPAMPKYKVYFFLTPQTMTNNEIAAVEKLKNDNRLLVFVHAPGLYSGQTSVETTIEKISGFKVTKLDMVKYEGTWEQKINLPYLKNLQGFFDHETYSVSYVFNREGKNALLQGQGFAVVDRDAVKLGTYSAMPDKTMVALKDFGTWKSVFYGGLRPDVKFIRNVALWGGAFDYCSSYDALWLNRQLLVFHSLASGKKVLHLPYPTNVTDLVTGKIIGKRLTEINLDLPYGETLIFGLESDKK
jgi:hypothetical protein